MFTLASTPDFSATNKQVEAKNTNPVLVNFWDDGCKQSRTAHRKFRRFVTGLLYFHAFAASMLPPAPI